MRKLLPLALSVLLSTSLLVPAATIASAAPAGPADAERYQPPDGLVAPADPATFDYGTGSQPRDYFVRVAGAPAAAYTGGTEGHEATVQREPDGTYAFDAEGSGDYREHLAEQQADVLTAGSEAVGRQLRISGSVTVANNGFVASMTPAEARALGEVGGVTWIQQVPEYELHTDAGPAWVNARGPVWDRPAEGLATGDVLGEGVVVGVIDTGINPSSPSFAAVSADGYEHSNPRGEGDYVGSCDPTNVPGGPGEGTVLTEFGLTEPDGAHYDPDLAELCNDKLIGMWGYHSVSGEFDEDGDLVEPGTPIDYDGHGSHTAGTAAGNFVDDVSAATAADVDGNRFDVSGVAPRANIIAYGACCTGAGLYSAVDQIVLDGVDVVNYSIGSTSPTGDLLQDPMTYGFLVARQNGIHVANSAGNSGPGNETIGSPSDAPWLTVVGSSTHDRLAGNVLSGLEAGEDTLADIQGKGVSDALPDPTELVYAGDHGNPLCLPDVWEPGEFDGEIVVCDRGETGRVDKSNRAAAAGAGGFVLANDAPNRGSIPGSLNGDSFPIPGVHITYDAGVELKDWMADARAAGETPVATIEGTVFLRDDDFGDIVSVYSSRGPNTFETSILSPHVTAPGHDILAPYGADDSDDYQFISGTSMSSPHVAGAYALLHEAFGDALSPAAVQSALQLTARRDVRKTDGETPADPYDIGSGHIDVAAALATGLVLDEDFDGYVQAIADATTADLNVPSLTQGQCAGDCTWTRTVTAPASLDGPVTWTAEVSADGFDASVSPTSFTLEPGESRELTVTADVRVLEVGGPDAFGSLELTPNVDTVSDAHLPIVVRPSLFAGRTALDLVSEGFDDAHVEPYSVLEAPDLQLTVDGLAPGTITDLEVAQDPTPGNPFVDLDEDHVVWFNASIDTRRLVVRVLETTSPDIDLWVGYDFNGDGQVQPDELIGISAAPGSDEVVDISANLPAGRYWVIVQNWESSPDGSDPVELVTATQRVGDVGNLDASAEGDLSDGGAFDLFLDWSLTEASTYWIGAVTMGSDASAPADIGRISLDIQVEPEAPVADAGGPYEVVVGEEVELDGTGSQDPEGLDLTYAWDLSAFGIDEPATSPTVTLTPDEVGEFEVDLTVTNSQDLSDSDTTTVTVVEEEPEPPAPGPACDDVDGVSFRDVAGPPHSGNIGCVAGYGIALGKGDGTYDPSGTVRRDQMASFLARTLQVAGVDLPAAPRSRWPDVTGGPHALAIDQLTQLGIIEGRTGGTRFDPSGDVTRAQMATFLVRTLEEVLGTELEAPRSPFTDTAGSVHASNIDVAYDLGIAEGRTATTFVPQRDVRRDQMGSFLARTLEVLREAEVELTPIR